MTTAGGRPTPGIAPTILQLLTTTGGHLGEGLANAIRQYLRQTSTPPAVIPAKAGTQ